MKKTSIFQKILWLGLLVSQVARAEFLNLATMPLQTTGSSDVLPNLMFVLDNSGSMNFSYTPDWANTSINYLFRNSAYNTQFYNPDVYYSPPLNYLGNAIGNQTNFTAVANAVDDEGNVSGGTVNLTSAANYFAYIPGEYCTTANLTSCIASNVATTSNPFPAEIRWCNSSSAATSRTLSGSMRCQKINNEVTTVNEPTFTFTNLRRPRGVYQLTLNVNSGSVAVTSIRINNIEILSQTTSASTSSSTLASNVRSDMCTSTSPSGNCLIGGNSVSRSGNVLTITTPIGDALNTTNPIQVTMSGNGSYTATQVTASSVPGSLVYVSINSGVTSYPSPGSTVKNPERTDCAGSTCTYTEEMTNYANWYTHYRTRMRAMKTAASQAFKALDARYRVGFVTINSPTSNYLAIAPFNASQKQSWYEKLFAATPSGTTPLRTALANVGRHFAGKQVFGTDDPMQYGCQSNFSLLTTDGYWNDTGTPRQINGTTAIGHQDGNITTPQLDSVGASNTLSDVSKYYYSTDIRDSAFSNCTGALGSSVCGTVDDYPNQSMVTLTLGLGISGTLAYTDDYKTQTVGDYADLKSGNKSWPDPTLAENGTRIDDLWHAAVNAGGTYYSASNPKVLRESLAKGLAEIKSIQGSAAAAAASSLAPVTGDNYQFVASYKTVKWTGNIEARQVDVNTLNTSEQAVWCVENVSADSCVSPATEYSINGKTYCKTANSNQSSCDSAQGSLGAILGFSESASCYVEIAKSCDGRLKYQLGNRKIYFNLNGSRAEFKIDSLPSQHVSSLNTGYLALSQMQGLAATDPKLTDANKVAKLVDFLIGNKTYEDSSANSVPANRLFREREATLGDISQSRPVYYKQSNAAYLDAGYTAYKNNSSAKTPVVYVGANDGMLHAFNANTGDELWAFIPTPVIPNLANLADKEYGSNYHTNFVNGSPVVTDICISGCSGSGAVWRTILVSGLNGGGRGYFALDVTDPASPPTLLWEFTAKDNSANLGFTFGNPVVTKLTDGRWVVLLTSGYNNGSSSSKKADGTFVANSPAGDGLGYLYVLNAYTGSVVRTLTTGSGSSSAPSGLSKIAAFADNMFENNTATKVYGGDLNGALWRFDINAGTVVAIANLTEDGGGAQKITTQPELGKIGDNTVVMVGTGKFLENADLTNTPQNSVYTLKDNNQTSPIGRSQLIRQVLTSSRTVTPTAVNFDNSYGWFIDFPAGERVNVDPLLLSGVLMVPTLVPSSASCNGGGYGWFNFFNYKNGGSLLNNGLVSERMTTPAVGFNIVYDTATNTPHVVVTGSDDPTPKQLKLDDDIFKQSGSGSFTEIFKQKSNGSYGTKQSWRELIQ